MKTGSNFHLERFGERIDWCIKFLEPNEEIVHPPFGVPLSAAIRNVSELWVHVAPLTGQSERTWVRAIGKESSVSFPLIRALTLVYPDLTAEILTLPTFAEFEDATKRIKAARDRWVDATRFVTNNRSSLAELGKRYHSTADELPTFPLIGKREWILSTPQELAEHDPLPERDMFTIDPVPAPLEGLNIGYQAIATRALERRRLRWNGDSYRVLKITRGSDRLDFTFGPTKYFNYVDSLEAMSAELADFALRNPGVTPSKLPRRGPADRIFDFRQRSAFAGVNCILLLKNYYRGNRSRSRVSAPHQFVLHDRRGDALEARNTFHVVPAGGHQPAKEFGNNNEWSIWRTIVREFCEELFDKEEAHKLIKGGGDFIEHPEIKPLIDKVFRKGAAKVFLFGVGLDPVTTKPEILAGIVVDWQKIDTATELHIETNYEGTAKYIDLSREELVTQAEMPRTKPMLPAGKAALLLAAQHYDFLMNSV
ncbi:MAG: hypothetical protein JOZ13_17435 [Alphaproteobacteria bacterium]|nr:hypothetical protein [Alphaproteobacteria bacterium]